ncbi:MAG: SdpI family protein [Candidatus Pacebacteria bacterium]|nr:SdpI family protein [Candidatus Paceibacterota bacterium]
MKIITKKEIIPIILILFSFSIGLFIYPNLPERLPSHWNIYGEVDSWVDKNFAVFFFPCLTLFIYLLMTFLPLIDPLRENYYQFRGPYFIFRTSFVVFLTGLYLYTFWAAFNTELNINYFILPALSLFFIIIGLFLPKIKRNYFVGIRTPWTIHSEEVWDKTHRFGGKVFIVVGVVALISVLMPLYSFWIFIVSALLGAFTPIVYSYIIFKKIKGFLND